MTICAFAQDQGIKELPVVERPRERPSTEKVVIRSVPAQPTKGVLAVVLDPIIAGKITIKDNAGRVLATAEADEKTGQAEFQLQRKKIYQIEAASPGYLPATSKSKTLGNTEVVRLKLTPQFATLRLPDLPQDSKVYLDNQLRMAVSQGQEAIFSDLSPGEHDLLIKHEQYNDYTDKLNLGVAGAVYRATVRLTRVAKLAIKSLPGATVRIDGEVRGEINPDGRVQIDYQLTEAAEHTIAVELLGYQTWTSKELLKPGPREIVAKLNPIITSKGTSDGFDNLSLWNAPSGWTVAKLKVNERTTTRLQVSGQTIGLLKDKTYRDFEAIFTIWLSDGKGATWAVHADKTGNNYYLFHLAGPKAGELAPRKLHTFRVKDGQVTEVNTPTPVLFEIKEKDSYTIIVNVSGHTIKHTLANSNGEESPAEFTDTSNDNDLFLYGRFGFLSFKGEVFQVDDFDIQPK